MAFQNPINESAYEDAVINGLLCTSFAISFK